MSWIKRSIHHVGALTLPSTATAFFIGLAIYENGVLRVFKHIFRNIMILTPRIPHVLKQMWNEKGKLFTTENLAFKLIILFVGMPFIAFLILLDDYEE